MNVFKSNGKGFSKEFKKEMKKIKKRLEKLGETAMKRHKIRGANFNVEEFLGV